MADEYRVSGLAVEALIGSISKARTSSMGVEVLRSIAGPPVNQHRFWRLLFPQRNQYVGLTRIAFMNGSTDLTSTGTLSASSTAYGSVDALADADPNSIWGCYTANGSQWLQIDFGVGVMKEVTSYTLYARPSYASNDSPRLWTLQWSDDAVNWNSVSAIDGQDGWSDNETRSYNRDFTGWRLVFTGTGQNGFVSLTEFELREAPSGPDLTTVNTPARLTGLTLENGYVLNNAKDGGTGTFMYVTNAQYNAAVPPYIGWRFDTPVTIAEVAITVRPDYGSAEGPSEFALQRSDDNGLSWSSVGYAYNLTWANAEKKVIQPEMTQGLVRASRAGLYVAQGQSGAQIGRAGLYTAEGHPTRTEIARAGLYVVQGPVDAGAAGPPLYRPRQIFIS